MVECKQSSKELEVDHWTLSALKDLFMEDFWTWVNSCGIGYDRDAYMGLDKCIDFEKEIWFELGK